MNLCKEFVQFMLSNVRRQKDKCEISPIVRKMAKEHTLVVYPRGF